MLLMDNPKSSHDLKTIDRQCDGKSFSEPGGGDIHLLGQNATYFPRDPLYIDLYSIIGFIVPC
jgi:hypothetical protein